MAQLTSTASKAIVPLTTQLTNATQGIGAATGLGQPVNSLLGTVGNNGQRGQPGHQQQCAAGVEPGGVVTEAGRTVAGAGVLLHGDGSTTNPLGGLLGSLPLSGLTGSGASSNPLAPVTGLLGGLTGGSTGGNPLSPVTSLLGGLGGSSSSSNPLAPVTNLVSSLTSGLGGAAGAAGGGSGALPVKTVLTPVTGLLGSATGAAGSATTGTTGTTGLPLVSSLLGGLSH